MLASKLSEKMLMAEVDDRFEINARSTAPMQKKYLHKVFCSAVTLNFFIVDTIDQSYHHNLIFSLF